MGHLPPGEDIVSFWTFFLYLIGALILIRVLYILFLLILVGILSPGKPDYHKMPTYAPSPTQPKLFEDHKSGELAKKLGDLSARK